MLFKVLWESFSVALLLYGSYLIYVFIWFSIYKILKIDIFTSKIISGSIVNAILLFSFTKWLIKKVKELKEKRKDENIGEA
ncbi:MAG: hypothetical protein DSY66_01755 [Persephonella sp.]|nr:MAG: hypothetical protein DSY66_01755 [Persephonella sp.]